MSVKKNIRIQNNTFVYSISSNIHIPSKVFTAEICPSPAIGPTCITNSVPTISVVKNAGDGRKMINGKPVQFAPKKCC